MIKTDRLILRSFQIGDEQDLYEYLYNPTVNCFKSMTINTLKDAREEVLKRDIKNLHYAPSSIFPNNAILSTLIENQNIVDIDTNYLNGPVAKTINQGKLKGLLIMNSHGGRPRKIESGELQIDVAFIACPTVDK